MAKWVYMFTEGNATMRNLLGGKGANLAVGKENVTAEIRRFLSAVVGDYSIGSGYNPDLRLSAEGKNVVSDGVV